MTLKGYPPPLEKIERDWTNSLPAVSEAVVTGPTMELLTADGTTLVFLEAVALP